MFRWHLVKNNEWPQNMTECFCQLDSANFEFRLLEFMEGQFLDDHAHPCKVFRWCYVDDIARALNDITRAFMQSERENPRALAHGMKANKIILTKNNP